MAQRRDVREVLAETRTALDLFETRLDEFGAVLDELDEFLHTQQQVDRRRGWQ